MAKKEILPDFETKEFNKMNERFKKSGGKVIIENKFDEIERIFGDLEKATSYAVATILDENDARSFYNGYVSDIKKNPDKYREFYDIGEIYVKSEIIKAIKNTHLTSSDPEYKIWFDILKGED